MFFKMQKMNDISNLKKKRQVKNLPFHPVIYLDNSIYNDNSKLTSVSDEALTTTSSTDPVMKSANSA